MPTIQAVQIFYGTLPLITVILLGLWNNNHQLGELSKRIDDLRGELNKRIDDLRSEFNKRIDDLRDFIHSEIRRLEHPIVRG